MKAGSKVTGHDEEMIDALNSIPIRPSCRDELNCTSHHHGGFQGQGKPSACKVTGHVYRGVEPVYFLWIESSNMIQTIETCACISQQQTYD